MTDALAGGVCEQTRVLEQKWVREQMRVQEQGQELVLAVPRVNDISLQHCFVQ